EAHRHRGGRRRLRLDGCCCRLDRLRRHRRAASAAPRDGPVAPLPAARFGARRWSIAADRRQCGAYDRVAGRTADRGDYRPVRRAGLSLPAAQAQWRPFDGRYAMILAEKITVTRAGRKLLDNVAIDLRAGLFTVVIGPNGAGKSTLMKVLSGEMQPENGCVPY